MWSFIQKLFSNNQVAEVTKFPKVVVGLIKEVKAHPNADRLKLTQVEIADKTLKIVCGANNIAAGQKVPVALVGAILPNGMEIKPAVIRGEASEGMLCAADELGLGTDHSGIKLLSERASVGEAIDKYLD